MFSKLRLGSMIIDAIKGENQFPLNLYAASSVTITENRDFIRECN